MPEKVLFPSLPGGSNTFVRKKALDGETESIAMEALTNMLYVAVGVRAVPCRYYPPVEVGGKAYILCRFIEGLTNVRHFDGNVPVKREAAAHYVLDALLQNYDLGGLRIVQGHSMARGNLAVDSAGNLIRVDNGGSLAARGVGGWKQSDYDCGANHLKRMQMWSKEPFSIWDLRLFSSLYPLIPQDELVRQSRALLSLKKVLLDTVDSFNHTLAIARVRGTLEARLTCLERILEKRPDLLETWHFQHRGVSLPRDICDGVRAVCSDMLAGTPESTET